METVPLILPQPSKLTLTGGRWSKASSLRVTIAASPPGALAAQAALLADYLREENRVAAEGIEFGEAADIVLDLSLPPRPLPPRLAEAGFADERHRITVTENRIHLAAASPAGVARGVQSLRQLFSGQSRCLAVPCLVIDDAPALGWRGLHLDVSRHFRDAADVRRFIDLAALHKFNLFHWHLTDDQGWRLPVAGYPRLTEIAAWRGGTLVGHERDHATGRTDGARHGGAYTEEEIRGIVAHAAARGVHILPEVDVPGHVQALVTAYPEFGNTGAAPGVREHWGISGTTLNLEAPTFAFLEKVADTLAALFPFRYIHFGGDEALTLEWAASPAIQARKRELGLATDRDVQGYFTARLCAMAAARGRAVIGWDEVFEHDRPPAGTAMMFWRDFAGREETTLELDALRAGHPLVLANHSRTYFDHYQQPDAAGEGREPLAIGGHLPLERVYAWRPLARYPEELRPGVLGAQAQLWTEYIPTRAHLDYMAYPRACALAQVLWTGEGRESGESFSRRLAAHLARLDRLDVRYRPMDRFN